MKAMTRELCSFFFVIILFLTGATPNCFAQSDSINYKILSIDTLKFNNFYSNGIPIISSKKNLIRKFGKPTVSKGYKINKGKTNHSKIFYYSFLNSSVKYSCSNTKLILSGLFFLDTISYIEYSGIVFSNKSTLSEIKEVFINSYQLRYEYPLEFVLSENYPNWDIYKKYPLICVPFALGDQYKLELFFSNEKLIFIDISEL